MILTRWACFILSLTMLAVLCLSVSAFAQQSGKLAKKPKSITKAFEFEYELDPYYSAINFTFGLTNAPIPDVGEKSELQIYTDLFFDSYIPRFVVLEASVNPMPLLGVAMKHNARNLYDGGEVADGVNIWKAVTAGFEEPWAASLFLGNVVNFSKSEAKRKSMEGGNKGYMGYLLSVGNLHIKNNELVDDDWIEAEWKIKGDRKLPDVKMSWSFRIGGKFHDNRDITDVVYVSVRRSRLDFRDTKSFLKNSAFEYTFDMDKKNLAPVQHKFFIEKKFPLKKYKKAFTMALGFIYDTGRKYSGDLSDEDHDEFQIILRPNIQF